MPARQHYSLRPQSYFISDIQVSQGERTVDSKSILNIQRLGAHQGDEILISSNSSNEEQAIKILKPLVKSNFEM